MAQLSERRHVGDWEVLNRVGSGSFSVVWKAQHRRTRQFAAVKEITTAKLSSDFAKCIDAELAAMRRVRHTNIVSFYELITEPGRMFVVMEYCNQGELQEVISKGRCNERYAQRCMIQLAAGLQALHSENIVHRDLKPANLLLTDGVLKIADFGFARKLPTENLADTLCGSPLYMAPEVLQRKKYDARADLWSVGVILYQMLVGKPPFDGQNYVHLVTNIETTPLRIPKSVAKSVSKPCLDLLVRLLQRDGHKRIDFEAFFDHPFITAPVPEDSRDFPGPESEKCEKSVREEGGQFDYSDEDGFVLVNRRATPCDRQLTSELSPEDQKLLRIADWIMDSAELHSSQLHGFFRALLSVQILQFLSDRTVPADPIVSEKLKTALAKAQDFSQEGSDSQRHCSIFQVYEVFLDDAVNSAQRAAADELCGQYCDSYENYSKSLELLAFLIEGRTGLQLRPPLNLKDAEKTKLQKLIAAIKQRRENCTFR